MVFLKFSNTSLRVFLLFLIFLVQAPQGHIRRVRFLEWTIFSSLLKILWNWRKVVLSYRVGLMKTDLQDGGGIRCGDQLPPHKYIRNTATCGTTPTEHLLNAGRRPQISQKGTDALRRPTRRGGAKSKAEPRELCEQRREREISPSSLRSNRLNLHDELDVPCISGIPE